MDGPCGGRLDREQRLQRLMNSAQYCGGVAEAPCTTAAVCGASPIDWAQLANLLPVGKDPDSRQKRHNLFSTWDPNGNGVLSLAEVDCGIEHLTGSLVAKPVVQRAFQAARNIAPPVHDYSDDYIDANEFRLFLLYLRYYLELWRWFSEVDTNGDRRVGMDEFKHAARLLRQWGCRSVAQVADQDLERTFQSIDGNQGGYILFDEFAHWVLSQGVDGLEDGDQSDRAEALQLLRRREANLCDRTVAKRPSADTENGVTHRVHRECAQLQTPSKPPSGQTAHAHTPCKHPPGNGISSTAAAGHAKVDTCQEPVDWSSLARMFPVGRDKESRQKRHALFSSWDPNCNGILSLAEVDAGIGHLCAAMIPKPIINRAFVAAREIAPPVHDFSDDYIDANEFRLFLVYLRYYLELWRWFSAVDRNGDRRLGRDEFRDALPLLRKWGCRIAGDSRNADVDAIFESMDCNHGGFVLFDEFAHWVLTQGVDGLEDGNDVERAEALGLLKQHRPNLCSADAEAAKAHKVLKSPPPPSGESDGKSESAKLAGANAIDVAGLTRLLPVGLDKESKQKRHALFSTWDPNGNGVLSLAEVDCGIEHLVGRVIPQPVVIRAFQAARALAPPVHEYSDDYIDANEFRLLLLYLRYYLELWRWFVAIDQNGDRRIGLEEFKAALPLLRKWGCHSLWESANTDAGATFEVIDGNQGGYILFDEFAHWILHQGVDGMTDGNDTDRAEALKLLRQRQPNLCSAGGRASGSDNHVKSGPDCRQPSGNSHQAHPPGASLSEGKDHSVNEADALNALQALNGLPMASSDSNAGPATNRPGRKSSSQVRSASAERRPVSSRGPSAERVVRARPCTALQRNASQGRSGSSVARDTRFDRDDVGATTRSRSQGVSPPGPCASARARSRETSDSQSRMPPIVRVTPAPATSSRRSPADPAPNRQRRECTCQYCPACRRRREQETIQDAVQRSLMTYAEEHGNVQAPGNLDGRSAEPAFDTLLGPGGMEEQRRWLDHFARARGGVSEHRPSSARHVAASGGAIPATRVRATSATGRSPPRPSSRGPGGRTSQSGGASSASGVDTLARLRRHTASTEARASFGPPARAQGRYAGT